MRYLARAISVLFPIALALSGNAIAGTVTLTCGVGKTIGKSLAKLVPGDVLQVSGTCTENIVIPSSTSDITIQGVNGATVQAADETQAVFLIRGRSIRIRDLTITLGKQGVQVIDGGFAWIDNNTISRSTDWGILVQHNAMARIWSNTIEDNRGGIMVNSNSSALIGVITGSDVETSANTIANSYGEAGIQVSRSSTARIVGNTISGNSSHGVLVLRGSQADVSSNTIDSNGGDGVQASHNSTLHLGQTTGTDIFALPNSTTTTSNNTGFGVSCYGGGYVTGRLGSLSGTAGLANIGSCSGSLAP